MKYILFFMVAAAITFSACGGEKVTPNGYHYTKYVSGSGAKANVGDYAFVHAYIFQDDSLVTSTRQMGQTVPVLLPDFTKMKPEEKGPGKSNPLEDAVSVMQVGDSISIDIPIDSSMRKFPEMANVKSMVWHVVLMEVKTEAQYQEEQAAKRMELEEKGKVFIEREPAVAATVADIVKQYGAGSLDSKLQKTTSGLKYIILEEGTGKKAELGKTVEVSYYGTLKDGTMFDNSFQRGATFPFPLGAGRVIQGWDEGIALLKEGDKAVLFIPSELGYGAGGQGSIPPNSELIFYVELEKVGG